MINIFKHSTLQNSTPFRTISRCIKNCDNNRKNFPLGNNNSLKNPTFSEFCRPQIIIFYFRVIVGHETDDGPYNLKPNVVSTPRKRFLADFFLSISLVN